jgi:hypothetical protein
MKEVIVQNNQSIWDLATQYLGSPNGVKLLIVWNPTLNFIGSPVAGVKIKIDESQIINQTVVDFFKRQGLNSASAFKGSNWILENGYWVDSGFWVDTEFWKDL